MVPLNWTFNSKGDHLTIFNWINWVSYFIFNGVITWLCVVEEFRWGGSATNGAAQEVIRKNAMEKALRLTNPAAMKASMLTAKFAGDTAEKTSKELNQKQADLASYMAKKPQK